MFKTKVHNGINIPKNKDATKSKPIVVAKAPNKLYFPMSMHIGKPAEPVVKVGDQVKIGSLLGEIQGAVSANVHSSVSGKVVDIKELEGFRGTSKTVIVENDFNDTYDLMPALNKDASVDDFVERIKLAGITGKGGAGFPTSVKYKADKDKMHYIVVNGAECEPYSTTDNRIMIEAGDKVLKAIDYIMHIYHIGEAHIAVENHMDEAIDSLNKYIKDGGHKNIYVHELDNEYPQGHAGLQIKEVLGIEIEDGSRTGDVGVLQSNVSTVKAIYDAVFDGKALTERVITVSGPHINKPENYLVKNGTPVSHLIDLSGGTNGEFTMINGGPMMGKPFENLDFVTDKDTTTLLFLDKKELREEKPCIRCARCINHCPMALQPVLISNAYKNNEIHKVPQLRSESCISCGVCSYVCPADIPLLENIQALNAAWKEKK